MKATHGGYLSALFCILSLHLCTSGAGSAAATPEAQGSKIILLGTGTPNPEPDRSGPATAIVVNGTVYLVDCGPGVVRRAAAAGLEVSQLRRLFVTHLHSDHTTGYPDLILAPWVLGRDQPLEVYGPAGIKAMTKHILAAFKADIRTRRSGLEPINAVGYKVNVHEIRPGTIYRDHDVTVKAFSVTHGSWRQAFGFRFETPDRTIVISGDTTANPNVLREATGCDVLIHEVYSTAGLAKRPPEWQHYHAKAHTSSVDLAKLAAQAKPHLLILDHLLLWGTSEEELLNEIRQYYEGKTVVGKDLQVY